jgi:hypothetical protein
MGRGNGADDLFALDIQNEECSHCPVPAYAMNLSTRVTVVENDVIGSLSTLNDVESRLSAHVRQLGSEIDRLSDVVQNIVFSLSQVRGR